MLVATQPQQQRFISVDVKVGQSITLDIPVRESITLAPSVDIRRITLKIEAKDGQRARVRVQADASITVGRPERAA